MPFRLAVDCRLRRVCASLGRSLAVAACRSGSFGILRRGRIKNAPRGGAFGGGGDRMDQGLWRGACVVPVPVGPAMEERIEVSAWMFFMR